MGGFQDVLDDIDVMARYWMKRKMDFLVEAGDEFSESVNPLCYYLEQPGSEQITIVNLCFTEWALFDRPLEDGMTPLELFVARRPVAMPRKSWKRLEQVAQTHYFSRFAICEKHPKRGTCLLEDVQDGERYEVFDEHLCAVKGWKDGTIALRIARVDGGWLGVGQARLYDRAEPEFTAVDGPGAIHPEERAGLSEALRSSFYLRLCHDVLGADGRYTPTMRVREAS